LDQTQDLVLKQAGKSVHMYQWKEIHSGGNDVIATAATTAAETANGTAMGTTTVVRTRSKSKRVHWE
jgi:hypothetical protein